MRCQGLQGETTLNARVDSVASTRPQKYCSSVVYERAGWFALVASLALLASCVSVPLSSTTTVNDQLQSLAPLQPGDVLVVYGESAPRREGVLSDYFSAGCLQGHGRDIVSYLIETILKVNPQPGMFAVKHLQDMVPEDGLDWIENPVLGKLDLTKAGVLPDHFHLRYAVYVREEFQPKLHLPLYAAPFGIASCSHKTVLEADICELQTGKYIGSFTVSAEGELTLVAYLLHMVFERDTQKDATEKLAREIVERLTGLKPLEVD